MKFRPKDVLAALVLLGFFVLKLRGIDGAFDPAIALILGYYFVKRENGADNGN